jgi:hypothetical protein
MMMLRHGRKGHAREFREGTCHSGKVREWGLFDAYYLLLWFRENFRIQDNTAEYAKNGGFPQNEF